MADRLVPRQGKLPHRIEYGGYPEIAQKDIEGAKITWRNMHVILRWLKIRTIQFSLFSLREPSRVFDM